MIEDTPNPQSSNGGGDRSLGISFVRRLEPKTLKHSLTHLLIKLTSLLGPKGKRSGSHKMSRSYDHLSHLRLHEATCYYCYHEKPPFHRPSERNLSTS